MPKVSIIIPVYNAKNFIEKCLENCMNQTFKDIEIIVVDDKSTDNTVFLVKSFMEKDNRIKLIELDKNYRQGYARNVAVKKSESDYIMFLDVDDAYENTCVEEMYNKISADDAEMTVCKFYTLEHSTGEVLKEHEFKNYANISENLYNGFSYKDLVPIDIFNKCNVVWDKIYKKTFLTENDIQFPAGMFCEDDVFSFRAIFRAKKISVLDKYLVYYRVNRSDSSSNLGDKTTFDCFKMYEMIKKDMFQQGLFYKFEDAFLLYYVNSFLFFYKSVHKKFKKEFFEKMQKELLKYQGYLENQQNKINDPILYKRLELILKNNFYIYEIKNFLNL